MDDILAIIGNLGFPIAVAAYLLVRIEYKLEQLTLAICELKRAIVSLKN